MADRRASPLGFGWATVVVVGLSLAMLGGGGAAVEPRGVGGGLVGWWTFDGASASRLEDVSGAGLRGERHGAPPGGEERGGEPGDALRFEAGRHDCVAVAGAAAAGSGYTYSVWIRAASTAGGQTVLAVGSERGPGGVALLYDGERRRVVFRHGGGGHEVASQDDSVPAGRWAHVAVTRDPGRKLVRLYVDGARVASVEGAADVHIPEPLLVLGGRCPAAGPVPETGEGGEFAGLVDDLRVYRRLLTSGEVRMLCGLRRAGPDTLRAAPAAPAQRFVESVGVATHFGYTDRKYYTEFDVIAEKLAGLGVTYVRDGIRLSTGWKAMRSRRLYDEHGIRLLGGFSMKQAGSRSRLVTDPDRIEAELDQIVRDYMSGGRSALLALEGPNEYELQSGGADPRWHETLKRFQRHLYTIARTRQELAGVPVIGPSITSGYIEQAGDYTGVQDASNMHPYPGGVSVGRSSIYAHFEAYGELAAGDGAPWVTETGYHNALGNAADGDGRIGHPGVPEGVAAKYLPRLYMEYFRIGIPRTAAYEFIDELEDPENDDMEANFGLLRYDLSEKPVYAALKNTLAVLSDPASSFTPEPLMYSLAGSIADVSHVVLQKQDGDHYLVLWSEVSSYDVPDGWRRGVVGEVLENAAVGVTVRFDAPKRLSAYRPLEGAEGRFLGEGEAFTIPVPDHLLILRIEHRGGATGE